eukprot:8057041-Pyramimonas_sp.AAC.2
MTTAPRHSSSRAMLPGRRRGVLQQCLCENQSDWQLVRFYMSAGTQGGCESNSADRRPSGQQIGSAQKSKDKVCPIGRRES